VVVSREHYDTLVEHARADAPDECCGYMKLEGGRVSELVQAENAKHSPYGYALGFKDLQAVNDLDDEGYGVAIYHSHPRSSAEPSQTDINLAHYPHWTYVIVSLVDERPVRAWRIADGRVEEEPVELA
jgi:proteasome lid subunit RPN8/RPN11